MFKNIHSLLNMKMVFENIEKNEEREIIFLAILNIASIVAIHFLFIKNIINLVNAPCI